MNIFDKAKLQQMTAKTVTKARVVVGELRVVLSDCRSKHLNGMMTVWVEENEDNNIITQNLLIN
ncbi:CLUMA_CG006734, isoform A [Clunio marinus]|uniref:CLUMA_CG006734, isoform A n=1 Tax=Clunio marinus TaxID=568069 RepID=A0A1J1I2V8_9DIPT|nr:CLUMA_CG006734, isoform A [Clunio marinus]